MELNIKKHTPEQLKALLGCFSIKQEQFSFLPLTSGLINDTYLVQRQNKPLYILQRLNHNIFTNVAGLMHNISKALDVLKSEDYTEISLLPTTNGAYYTKTDHGYWRLMTFITGSTTYDTTNDTHIAFEAGRIIGEFHTLLKYQEPLEYKDTIPRFHDLTLREEQFKNALAAADTLKLKSAIEEITFTHKTLLQLKNLELDSLKTRICHNDTKLNNILFSKASNKALCLIDLDTIMKGYFFYDFGDAVRTVVNTAPEDETILKNICFNESLFSSFVEGLASNPSFLTKQELKSLPLGVIFMPFIHGLRALTDYLENNKYYKVTYENQNLDRCKSLFDFSQKALDKIPFMEGVLNNRLA